MYVMIRKNCQLVIGFTGC